MNLKQFGYIRAAAITPKVTVADCKANYGEILRNIDLAEAAGADVAVFPELCITGYTCSDLFLQQTLLAAAEQTLLDIAQYTGTHCSNMLVVVGLPMEYKGSLYNTAAVIQNGLILGIVPKTYLPAYSEFYEARHFSSGRWIKNAHIMGDIPFGTDLLFRCQEMGLFCLGVEICEDLWATEPPSGKMALQGATIIANLSASNETVGKAQYRRALVASQSSRLISGYIYADAGEGESTTDLVYAGHNLIVENGAVLKETKRFETSMITADLDLEVIAGERRRMGTFGTAQSFLQQESLSAAREISFKGRSTGKRNLDRRIPELPFVPASLQERIQRCREILDIQTAGLRKRLEHIGGTAAVIGVSGGLDSTLALLVTVRTFDAMGLDRAGIHTITIPCFGTTDRTYQNALRLCKELGTSFREIPIADAVRQHFSDIGHDEAIKDITYENSQARERTQILMDVANQVNGLVIGTGDLSELALGWATYNGDHMSMYGLNASIPKTLIRYLVEYCAEELQGTSHTLSVTLQDILNTPVSPELLPPKDGEIMQKTEETVGPYELHDFFLYHMVRLFYTPGKILFLARKVFQDKYEEKTILKWLTIFYRRFFSQQFKRSCLPDGPKVGSVSLSPRGDFRMPSDASVHDWLRELETFANNQ